MDETFKYYPSLNVRLLSSSPNAYFNSLENLKDVALKDINLYHEKWYLK